MITIVRGEVFHTPRNPFESDAALEWFDDGAVAFEGDGTILVTGSYTDVRRLHPDAHVHEMPGAILLPGMVDTHVHFPQQGIIGAMGLQLLEWLQTRTLPEEARMADDAVACETARGFLRRLAANGTTTALVIGSHFPSAQEILFSEAEDSGLRITSGLVVSDRELLPELHLGGVLVDMGGEEQVRAQAERRLAGLEHPICAREREPWRDRVAQPSTSVPARYERFAGLVCLLGCPVQFRQQLSV